MSDTDTPTVERPKLRGGYHPKAGRPKGSKDKPKEGRQLWLNDLAKQFLPILRVEFLEMGMIDIMQWAARIEAANGNWRSAAQMASLAAPYLYPRLSQVESNLNVNSSPKEMSSQELEAIIVANYQALEQDTTKPPEPSDKGED